MLIEVGRLAGGLLVRAGDEFHLVGELKEPCDWAAAGFEDPGEIKNRETRFTPLSLRADSNPDLGTPRLNLQSKSSLDEISELLFARLVIQRNGSVSERLWHLIFDAEENEDLEIVEAGWLTEMPGEIWEIIREQVLRCV